MLSTTVAASLAATSALSRATDVGYRSDRGRWVRIRSISLAPPSRSISSSIAGAVGPAASRSSA